MQIRTQLRPGDIGMITSMHGLIYAKEYGWDHTFEAYVAGPLAAFALRRSVRECIWIAEHEDRIVGCIAIVESEESSNTAQLRWYLVDASARGHGLGKRLLDDAIAFARAQNFSQIILWTTSELTDAAKLYRSRGFTLLEEKPSHRFGVELLEQKYAKTLLA